ncbi:hypothetical protein ACO2Q8_26840 [Larkinella sp. VNQ87]|uniref:hypothetical protein n=1 Tax=Larkinella sp. VNQ87 TaxID=3400921 RepID=UPI003C117AEC
MKTLINYTLTVLILLLSAYTVQAQVKIGSNPTTPEPTSNLEVEASTPNRKVKVNKTTGQLTIQDGTEGTGKVLTSDAVGGASWQSIKTTAVSSTVQITGVRVTLPTTGPGSGFCAATNNPPACATNINQNASFTVTKSTNDVIIDYTAFYSVANNTTQVQFQFLVYVDKTTPGVFEYVGATFVTVASVACTGGTFLGKYAIKDLSPRTYNVRVYVAPWTNTGTPATLGVGLTSSAACGANSTNGNNLIVSVSE